MSEEKVRVSGDLTRPAVPALPTLNPDAEKAAAEKANANSMPTFVYVGYDTLVKLSNFLSDISADSGYFSVEARSYTTNGSYLL